MKAIFYHIKLNDGLADYNLIFQWGVQSDANFILGF